MKSRTRDTTERLHFHFSCTGEGNGNPLQCSCLENPRDGRAWWAAIYGVSQSRTRLKRLSSSSIYNIFHSEDSFEQNFHITSLCSVNSNSRDLYCILKMVLKNNKLQGPKASYPEKAMAPHSSTLAWKVPWTEEPGRLQSMGL